MEATNSHEPDVDPGEGHQARRAEDVTANQEQPTGHDPRTAHSDTDRVLIEALGHDLTYQEAGKQAGVSARTVARRTEDPAFTAAVKVRRSQVAAEAVGYIRRIATARVRGAIEAQQVLVGLLHHEDPKVQLAAARQLYASRAVHTAINLEERVLQLEGRLESPGAHRPPEGWDL